VEHLVLRRSESDELCPGEWQVITGALLDGERVHDAARRELAEEAGLASDDWRVIPRVAAFYFEPLEAVVLSPILACRIDDAAAVMLSEEHVQSAWLTLADARQRLAFESQAEGATLVEESLKRRRQAAERPESER
jgi:8-oxo-dGTP pyrophosphatase MutT (NUDIX family)